MDGIIALAYAKRLYDLAEGPQGPQGEPGSGAVGTLADAYSSSKTYAVGDYVIHNEELYVCTTAITTAESFTAAHWSKFLLIDEVTDLKSEINDIAYYEIGKNLYNADEAVTGFLYSDGRVLTGGSYDSYKTSDFIPITAGESYTVSTWRGTSHQNARIITAFYSASKTMLSGAYDNQSGLNVKTVTAPTGASYIRICANETMQLEEGSTATAYEAYKKTPLLNATLPLTEAMQLKVTADIGELDDTIHAELGECVKSEIGKNKFNPQTSESGYLGSYNGNIESSDSYKTTDFIDISGFVHSVCVTGYERFSLQYDENKTPIQTSYRSSAVNNPVISIAEGACYIRISYYNYQEQILQIEDGTTQTAYEPYVVYAENSINCLNTPTKTAVQNLIGNKARNVLYGKKWIPFGDSFTEYTNKTFDSGVFSGKAKTYPRLIAERNEMTIDQKFFMSGRTMAYPSDGTFTNSATCPTNDGYFQNIPADADYITIMLGINDVNHQSGSGQTPDGEDATGVITLGTIDDATTETYFGAYNTVLSWIHENRPFAHVGIIVTNGTTRQDYTEAQIALAKKWGYPYINLNGDERTSAFIRCYNPNMPNALKESLKEIQGVNAPTDTHPNWQTHELESTIIEEWLRSL